MTGGRQVPPFFCPYCGESDIVPYGERDGGWRCESCLRAFAVRNIPASQPTPDQEVTA